ncbi:MAG: hypothetical protein HY056_01495 [Proteobacteria bacterium]|nr:hypothetical protein [Pseudomonadota bacterium]
MAPPPREPSATRRTVAATLLDAKSPQPPAKVAARATRVRHAARVTKKAASRPESSVATKTVFAVDLGGATTIDALRVAWTALKSNQNILVDGLQPLISVRDKSDAVELRLVVGPLANAALAARLCAAFASAGRQCEPAVFDGQRLTAN